MRTAVILLLASVLHVGGMAIATWEEEKTTASCVDEFVVIPALRLSDNEASSFPASPLPPPLNREATRIGEPNRTVPFIDAMGPEQHATPFLPPSFHGDLPHPPFPEGVALPWYDGSGTRQPFHAGEGILWQVTGSSRNECGYAMPFLRKADLLASHARSLRRTSKPISPDAAPANARREEGLLLLNGFTF